MLVIPTLIGILTAVFILLQLIPGDPAIALAGDKASPEQIEEIREEYGLNRPLPIQYAYFVEVGDHARFRPVAADATNR